MSDLAFTPVVAPRILAIVNQKGGVGKTTTAVNLATAMAACRKRVLVVDLDPQGNASTGFGVPRKARGADSYAVLLGEASIAEAAIGSSDERRVGKEWFSPCSSRWSPFH